MFPRPPLPHILIILHKAHLDELLQQSTKAGYDGGELPRSESHHTPAGLLQQLLIGRAPQLVVSVVGELRI